MTQKIAIGLTLFSLQGNHTWEGSGVRFFVAPGRALLRALRVRGIPRGSGRRNDNRDAEGHSRRTGAEPPDTLRRTTFYGERACLVSIR